MSRKSKEILIQERLEEISHCPEELFRKIEPSDEIFAKIQIAEQGDISAIRELCTLAYETYKYDCEINPAILYYAKLGIPHGDLECALAILKCMEKFNDRFDLLDDVLMSLEGKDIDDSTEALITRIKVQKILSEAAPEANYAELTDKLSKMYDEYAAYARIYLASRRLADTGSYDKAKIDPIAIALEVPNILTLPVFTGDGYPEKKSAPANVENECEALRFALSLILMDEWQDFWLRAIYEYSQLYLDKDLSIFAEDIKKALLLRCEYPRRKLHILAIDKYLVELGKVTSDEFEALYLECRFDGFDTDIYDENERNEIIKDAVYTDSLMERKKYIIDSRLGTQIKHTKNRYLLKATVNNHMKRGCRHMWDITLSIETGINTLPIISTCKIGDRKNEVSRNGIKLEKERKLSQIFCMGEIQLGDKIHPLEYDLILDISYVSSTKCEYCEVKIKNYHRVGDFIVMDSMITIY